MLIEMAKAVQAGAVQERDFAAVAAGAGPDPVATFTVGSGDDVHSVKVFEHTGDDGTPYWVAKSYGCDICSWDHMFVYGPDGSGAGQPAHHRLSRYVSETTTYEQVIDGGQYKAYNHVAYGFGLHQKDTGLSTSTDASKLSPCGFEAVPYAKEMIEKTIDLTLEQGAGL